MLATPSVADASAPTMRATVPASRGFHTDARPEAPALKNAGAADATDAHHTAAASTTTSIAAVTATANAPSTSSSGRDRVNRRAVAMAATVHSAIVTTTTPAQTRKVGRAAAVALFRCQVVRPDDHGNRHADGQRSTGCGARDLAADQRPATRRQEAHQGRYRQHEACSDSQTGRRGGGLQRGVGEVRQGMAIARQGAVEMLRQLCEARSGDDERGPCREHHQGATADAVFRGTGTGQIRGVRVFTDSAHQQRHGRPNRKASRVGVVKIRGEVPAVSRSPAARVAPEQPPPAVHAGRRRTIAVRASRLAPTSASRRMSATASASAAEPAAVMRYGRRRSSLGSASMSSCCSSRVMAP